MLCGPLHLGNAEDCTPCVHWFLKFRSCSKETCPMLHAVFSKSYLNTELCFVIDMKPVTILWIKYTLGNAGMKDNILDVVDVISTETWCHQRLFHKDDRPVHCC